MRSGGRATSGSPPGSPTTSASAAPRSRGTGRGRRQARDPRRRTHLPLVRPRRPHRAAQRRPLCDPRLQDRAPADRQAGADRRRAAADAEAAMLRRGGFGDVAAGGFDRRARLCEAQGRRTGRRGMRRRAQRALPPMRPPTRRWRGSHELVRDSRTKTRRTARWCCRCGSTATAPMTISPASRNGRSPAAWGGAE